ncbi:WD40 repeat domain-containing protein [Gaetbulibacter saemankumensis]|uniref:hypothetical protein n=1 Tax=Gaetbulibacter saemankumensis TaxID=311208 RepID=UPI000426E03B|nr:hypothetical protein [Gaetbulibacter saemankumensis]
MRLNKIILFFFIVITTNCFSQVDVNRCFQEIKEDFSPRIFQFSNNYLLTNSNNENTIYLINKNKIKIFSTLNYGVVNAVIDSDEKRIAISYYDNNINIYDVSSTLLIKKLSFNSKANSLVFVNEALFYGLDDGTVGKYNFKTQKTSNITTHKSIVRGLLINGNNLLSISQDGVLEVNEIHSNNFLKQIFLNSVLTTLAISPNEKLISIGTFKGEIYILNENYQIEKKLHPHRGIITKLDFIDNNNLLSSSFDKTLIKSNLKNNFWEVIYRSNDYITTFDYNQNRIIFGSRNGITKYYNLNCQAR